MYYVYIHICMYIHVYLRGYAQSNMERGRTVTDSYPSVWVHFVWMCRYIYTSYILQYVCTYYIYAYIHDYIHMFARVRLAQYGERAVCSQVVPLCMYVCCTCMYVCMLILFMYIHIFVLLRVRHTCTRIYVDAFGVQTIALGVWSNRIQFGMCHPMPYGVATMSRSLKLQVSFVKETYKRDDILQNRPIILRSLLIEATPYIWRMEN